jgi:hypothetical protein
MIELTLGEINLATQSLKKLSECDLPINIAYRITKIIKVINSELEHIENLRMSLINKYGKQEPGKDMIVVPSEKQNIFLMEFNKLLEEKVNLDFEPALISDLKEYNIKLSAMDLIFLEKFLKTE